MHCRLFIYKKRKNGPKFRVFLRALVITVERLFYLFYFFYCRAKLQYLKHFLREIRDAFATNELRKCCRELTAQEAIARNVGCSAEHVFTRLRVSVIVLRVSLKLDICNFRQCRVERHRFDSKLHNDDALSHAIFIIIRFVRNGESRNSVSAFRRIFPGRFNFHPNRPITPKATHTKVITFWGYYLLEGRSARTGVRFLLRVRSYLQRINVESKFPLGDGTQVETFPLRGGRF